MSSALAAVVLLLIAYPVAELAARWWIRCRSRYYVFAPGWRGRLHLAADTFPGFPPITRFLINRDGERGDEPPLRAKRLYRVLVGGGSQPEGTFLDHADTWPVIVQRTLASPEHLDALGASSVHVGNIGRSGVGSEELDVIFTRVLPQYRRLHLIIVLVGVSDVVHWLERGASCTFPAVNTSDVFKWHPEGSFGWTPRKSAIVELLRRARCRWLRPVEVHLRAGAWIGRARAMRARATEIRTTMPNPEPMLEHFELHFDRLLRRAKTHADRVLVVRQPWFEKEFTPDEAAHMWHAGVGQPWRQEVTTYYSLDIFTKLMSLLDARAAKVCDALDIEHLDLMPTIDQSLATFYDGFHPTPAGARAVAVAVTGAILRPLMSPLRARDVDAALVKRGRDDSPAFVGGVRL